MNHGIYRLVFSREHNSWVAVAENVRGRGKKSSRRRLAAVALGLVAVAAGNEMVQAAPPALPVPATARPFVFAGTVNGGQPTTVGNTMTINTASRTLGLNWQSFNIGSGAKVEFVQPDAGSRVLNRIWDASPTQIMGQLKANGQVYLVNQNGILFGNGAQVNVGGLVASSLNLSEAMASKLLNSGLPTLKGEKLEFAWDGSAAGFNDSYVMLEAGARITTPSGGRVVLIAPKSVQNLGLIEGGAGAEAILAAGGKVILTAPDDPSLRGLLVETQSFAGKDVLGNNVNLDGTVTNKSDGVAGSDNGRIRMGAQGVVSLAALAVNQQGFVNASRAVNLNGTTMLVSGKTESDRLTINQRGDKVEIDWAGNDGFAVAAGQTVEFVQPSTAAVAYNYVYDPDRGVSSAGRSTIDGKLFGNGQIYLINEKGISFGASARVSAANFVASALGMNPDIATNGIFSQDGVSSRGFYLYKTPLAAADQSEFEATSASARADFAAAKVDVAKGASIASTVDSGFVMLFGTTVNQGGTIRTSKGQTLVAAGAEVYLKPPFSAGLRGFMAEVNPLYVIESWTADKDWGIVEHGTINNAGRIEATLGDISLVAYDINQAGTLMATSSATANGSIHLVARDQVTQFSQQRNLDSEGIAAYKPSETYSEDKAVSPEFIVGRVGGTLNFAAGSVTEVAIDGSSGKTISPDQTFIASSIDVLAKKINIAGASGAESGAELIAHGGRIRMMAQEKFDLTSGFVGDPVTAPQNASPLSGVGIFVGDGARLDVSGSIVQKSVADLFVEVELRGDEFANNPVQRFGKLRGQKAWVDIRDKFAIADLSGWTDKIGQTVEEKTATGGSIALRSTGSVIVKPGAVLDVSGGAVNYAAATVAESLAITTGGKAYRLNDAPASATYADLITVERGEASYSEGKSAGTVEVVGHNLALDGQLKASTTPGARQRNVGNPASDRNAIPLGGQLIVKDAGQHYTVGDRDTASDAEKMAAYRQAQVVFVKGAAQATSGFDADSSAGPRLELSSGLVEAGFSRFNIQSDGRIEVNPDVALNLAAGGAFSLAGRQVYVAGDISAPSGTISLSTRDMSLAPGPFPTSFDARYSTLVLADGATLSTAGTWVNDYRDGRLATTPKAIQGGNITLNSAYDLDLQAGSRVDVSGGARLGSDGKLEAGNAGSIVLSTGGMDKAGGFDFINDSDRRDASLFLDGTLAAYALGAGGKLEINTSAVQLGTTFSADSRDWSRSERLAAGQVGAAFDAGFFNRGGFYEFKLVGRDGLTVADNTRIAPTPINWSLQKNANYRYVPTGTALGSFADTQVLHPELRSAPTRLSLATRSLEYGDLMVGDNAYLGVSPQGSIDLESRAQLTVLGTLEALAGSITLSRPANHQVEPYNFYPIAYSEAKQAESIFLGAKAHLLAGGTTVLDAATRNALEAGVSADQLRSQNRYKGQVLDGGRVDIDAGLGYLVTASDPASGSRALIDVAGAEDRLNIGRASAGGGVSYALQTVGSNGGHVNLAAREGMFLDGAYAAGGKAGGLGGIFSLRLYEFASGAGWDSQGLPASMSGPRQLTLFQSTTGHPAQWTLDAAGTAEYLAGAASLDSAQYDGKASLDLAPLVSGGFGSWYVSARDEIRFDGKISATVANQLRLDAPRFSASSAATQVDLRAAAIQLGNFAPAGAPETSALTGSAIASFTARDIGISGNFTWNGFASSLFSSLGEIHFDSTANTAANRIGGRNFSGQMTAAGSLEFSAARLSPSTFSDYRVDLSGDANATIKISRMAGSSAAASLSAGGRLEFAAGSIEQLGTVVAPLGEIVFTAPGGTVTLGKDSLTSVSADRTLMLGQTDQSGRLWQFQSSYWNPYTQSISTEIYNVDKAPAKAIRIDAAKSELKNGATLDLSGGGDAMAWEFTPGPGGKTDILAQPATSEPGVFAILPLTSWAGSFAAPDSGAAAYYNVSNPTASKSSDGTVAYRYDSVPSLKAGDQIQIGSGSGLAAGSYTLLPARYALLPGAYLVSVKTTSDSTLSGARLQADGSWLLSGTRLAANADGSTSAYAQRPLSIELASSATTALRAGYQITTASEFFADTAGAKLPQDVGLLSVVGRESLIFDPTIVAARRQIELANGSTVLGQGLEIDLAAPKLLVSDGGPAPDDSWSVVDQNKLNALAASSLVLGGVRTLDGDTTHLETISSQVRIDNHGVANPAKALAAPEVMLSALADITVSAGSRIDDGNVLAAASNAGQKISLDNADGAFLRVASGAQATLTRNGVAERAKGDLILDGAASLAGKSLILDATHATSLPGSIEIGVRQADGSRQGGAMTIGAGRINVIGDASTPTDGLTLSNDSLQAFAKVDQLRLTSYTTLDLYGNARLGSENLKELAISATGIAGHGEGDASALLQARTLRFDNLNPAVSDFTANGLGQLTAQADTLVFGGNATLAMREAEQAGFAIRGFNLVVAKASADIRFEGNGVTSVDNLGGSGKPANLTLDAGRVTSAAGADHLLSASGTGLLTGGNSDTSASGLGGALDIRAAVLDVDGRIELPAGSLALTATSGDLKIKDGARLSATGAAVTFADTTAYAPAGKIVLGATAGDITVESGALLSVDGVGGDAGQLSLVARQGRLSLAADTLRGKADNSTGKLSQGKLLVDAAQLSLDELASAVVVDKLTGGSQQHHFSGSWDIRARNDNLSLAAGAGIVAGKVTIAADNGNIDIAGSIDASGAKGGSIALYANRGANAGGHIDLQAGSLLKASATEAVGSGQGTAGRGGSVIVAVSASEAAHEMDTGINFAAKAGDLGAAVIDVSTAGGSQAPQGTVVFSTPRSDTATVLKTLANATLDPTTALTVATASGTASAFALSSGMSSYQTGMLVAFKAPAANASALTLNIDAQGAKAIVNADGSALGANDIKAGQVVVAVYDGNAFRLSATGQQDTGTGSAYAVALASKPVALTPGQIVTFQAKSASTAGTVTLTLNGDTNLRKNLLRENGSALGAGYITANQLVTAVYTGTDFRIVRDTNLVASGILDSRLAPVNLAGNVVGAGSVMLQGMAGTRKTGDYTIDFKQQALLMAANAQSAAVGATALRTAADPGARLNLKYLPGIDVLATGDITVSSDWALGGARYQGAPGVLSLRAGGDLNISATISDGFSAVPSTPGRSEVSRDAALNSAGDSWSYRFAAGVEMGATSSAFALAANPLAVQDAPAVAESAAKGSIILAANKLVRTGSGDIAMAARRDIKLYDRAAVYTAGIADTSSIAGFSAITSGPATNSVASVFPSGGGDISLQAGENLIMAKLVNGVDAAPTLRHVNQWLFKAGANRNIQWWSRIPSFEQGVATFGGGDIDLQAGKDIRYFTAATPTNGRVPMIDGIQRPDLANIQGGGDLSVHAGASVIGGLFYTDAGSLHLTSAQIEANTGIALGNADAHIVVRGNADLGNVFNPLMVKSDRIYNNASDLVTKFSSSIDDDVRLGNYGEATALDLLSVTGDVSLNPAASFYNVTDTQAHMLAPSLFKVAALNGDIAGSLTQAPGSNGQLDLLAAGSILLKSGSIRQLDVPVSALPSIGNPLLDTTINLLNRGVTTRHAAEPWHLNDTEESRLVALTGDISGEQGDANFAEFSESLLVSAGGNIKDLSLSVQHLRTTDVSSVSAGGNIEYTVNGTRYPSRGIKVSGPGRLEVTAGGSIDLGDSKGIVSNGNLENSYLPEGGADIAVMAGVTAPDYAAFLKYLQDNHLSVGSDTTPAGLRARFYTVLRDFGREALAGGGEASYEKGRAAIRALFPSAVVTPANIDLFYSAIKTEQGGDLSLLAPGGGITVGIATPNQDLLDFKKASEQGLFTIRGGAIDAYVKDSFLVNQSRVFTLDGGDIMIWADQGSIDAGSGAKTVSATPPPVLVVRGGQIILDASNSVSGSGIGVLKSRDSTPVSDMDLYAPQGAIDAGDAGLRSTGKIKVGAPEIRNPLNIKGDGGVEGVQGPVAAPAPVAMTTTPSNNENKVLDDVASVAGKNAGAGGMLTVEVLDSEPPVATVPVDAAATPRARAPGGNGDEERKRNSRSGG